MSDSFDKPQPPAVASRIPAQAHADAKKQQQVIARLVPAGQALRELLALLPPSVHRLAIEMVAAEAAHRDASPPDESADRARIILTHARLLRERSAPVLRLVSAPKGDRS